jgi:uncharacterized membrane protein YkvI
MLRSAFFQKYLLPGFVFQSIIIGGGYGTGRELIEWFMSLGPAGGLAGMAASTVIMGVVLAFTFELGRQFKAFDYRTFMKRVLGPGWRLFEVIYLAMLVLIISVMGSAAGELLERTLGWPKLAGIVVLIAAVGWMAFNGNELIERVFSVWSVVLYITFAVVIVTSIVTFGSAISGHLEGSEVGSDWFMAGVKYAGYNVGLAPAMFFALRHVETRKEAMSAGLLAGLIGMIPASFVFVGMLGVYPGVVDQTIPVDYLLEQMNTPWLRILFQIVLFGTLIETGVGVIHGFNERIAGVYHERGKEMPSGLRMGIAAVLLLIAIFLADAVGIVDLIAKGYGTLTWAYWLVFLLPVLVIGMWRLKLDRN